MSSPSDSISPGAAPDPADPLGRIGPRRSLRTAVVLAFAPLCVVVVAGLWLVFLDARAVRKDLQRMFEESREVALTRALLDDLRGLEQWVEAVPEATAATHPLVLADLRHHHSAAAATFARFLVANDPSEEAHSAEERGIQQRIRQSLATIEAALGERDAIDRLAEPLTLALHSATVLAHIVDDETRDIGAELDRRSEGMVQFMVLLGIASAATVVGLAWLLHRRVLVPVRELRASSLALGQGQDLILPVRHPDELGDLAQTFAAMAGQLGESRRELEQRVEMRSREVLRSAQLAQLGTLAAGIAHEINNPLASIAACAEGLLRESDAGQAHDATNLREYLQIIRKEAMRTRDITTRLLRFARHDESRREIVWLGTEVQEVAPLFQHQLKDAGITLTLVAEAEAPAILGDPSEWRQVLFNLLRNALDACSRGGRIELRCTAAPAHADLVVTDDGPGIDPALLDRIFEPFFTTKDPGKGTGLGLAIVHRIVTAHGGTITADNPPGGGARFHIRVPRHRLG